MSDEKEEKEKLDAKSTELIVLDNKLKTQKKKKYPVDTDLFFDIFGNDIRRKIISKLTKFPRYASDLAIDLGISKQATKKHINKLLKSGFIQETLKSKEHKYGNRTYYEITDRVALFLNMVITPDYFHITAENKPEKMEKIKKQVENSRSLRPIVEMTDNVFLLPPADEELIKIAKSPEDNDDLDDEFQEKGHEYFDRLHYDTKQLEQSLKSMGKSLIEVEQQLKEVEKKKKLIYMEKIALINRLKIIINSLVQDELEKEIILSFFFDINTSLEGLSYEDILKKLFIQKKKRAGVKDYDEYRSEPEDSKYINRGKKLLAIIQMFIRNFDFIRQDINNQIYFEF